MGFVIKLFFLVVLSTIVLSIALGWFALLKARMHINKAFGPKPNVEKQHDANVIEGEYKVLHEEEK